MDLSIIFGVIVFVVESSLEWAIPKLRAITFQACLWFGFYCFYIALRVATIETLIITWEYYSISEIFGSHSIMAITLWTFCSILTASLTHTENELLCLFGVVGAIKASNHLQGQVDRISRNELASKLPKVDDLRLGGRCYEVALQYDCHHTVVETVQCQEHVMIDPIKDDKSAILQCCVHKSLQFVKGGCGRCQFRLNKTPKHEALGNPYVDDVFGSHKGVFFTRDGTPAWNTVRRDVPVSVATRNTARVRRPQH